MITIETMLRERLIATLVLQGTNPSRVARDMGRSRTWLLRKLSPSTQREPRPLLASDCDAVMRHLQLDPLRLFRPVLLAGDLDVLRACLGPRQTSELDQVFKDLDRVLARLVGQGLLDLQPLDAIGEAQVQTTIAGQNLLPELEVSPCD